MITEDHVSFETAKLLKEKGFKGNGSHFYEKGRLVDFHNYWWRITTKQRYEAVEAPTLQMAMKWLRIKHSLSVEVYRTACGYIGCIVNIPSGTDIKFLEEDGDDKASGTYTKHEFACEAAIKYCLENLI